MCKTLIFFFRLLVGAPKAQTGQRKIVEGGAVYKCKPLRKNCEQVPFDTNGKFSDMSYD